MIGIVTDSSAQVDRHLAAELGVEVVPILVTLDGEESPENELDIDHFYERLAAGAEITTSQPSPGHFVSTYEAMAADGIISIVSIHVGSAISGTVNSARLAAERVDLDVRVLDTGLVSFGVGCCVWTASVERAAGGDLDAVVTAAESAAQRTNTVFIIQALDMVEARGRSLVSLPDDRDAIPVYGGVGDAIEQIASGRDPLELAEWMADWLAGEAEHLLIGVSYADPATLVMTEQMEDYLAGMGSAAHVIRYRVSPSVATYAGPGTAGGYCLDIGPHR